MSALLEVNHLNAFYGASHVLQDISLVIEQGKIICLLGRNGMGKSTTLKGIMGLVKPKSGTIQFKGQQIAGLPPIRFPGEGSATYRRSGRCSRRCRC
jgi:branched-chain amino acid transport system ATP-binding protein